MKVNVEQLTDFKLVRELARVTVNKDNLDTEVSEDFKRKILLAEHSPIRALMFKVTMIGIPYYVSVHLSRHKNGVEHFVSTQRTDRTGQDRSEKYQDALVNHTMILNAQALINMSRKRLCYKADSSTIALMKAIKKEISRFEPTLAIMMIKECIYRGTCPEMDTCGYYKKNELYDEDIVYLKTIGEYHEQ